MTVFETDSLQAICQKIYSKYCKVENNFMKMMS
jgi:hypothetical protein